MMIKALQDWAMILSGVAVFGSLCEVVLPEGSFQKYIRLGLGMVLVLALLSPVKELLHQEWELGGNREKRIADKQIDVMEERQREEVLRVYQGNLEKKMLSCLQTRMPEFSGRIQCRVEEGQEGFGVIQEVTVISDGEVDGERVRYILAEEFGVIDEQIHLVF